MLKAGIFFLLATVAVCQGVQQSNYDVSRKRPAGPSNGIEELNYESSRRGGYGGPADGGVYGYPYPGGYYPGQYPGGYNPGQYPGGYNPGQYPGGYNPGPPGAHPGCPLCDSSVYSYCSYKQRHDSCCCDISGYGPFGCRSTDCGFIYANTCEEYNLISRCCCVDVQKSGLPVAVPVPVAG